MSTFRRAVADTDRPDAVSARRLSPAARRAALLAAVALLSVLTACGNDTPSGSPKSLSGTAEPASGDTGTNTGSAGSSDRSASPTPDSGTAGTPTDAASASATASSGNASTASSRCHTSELRASVGGNDPGAGQENFPIVLTNRSGRTCTVRGYPGAAFVDASGKQLGPDPQRSTDSVTTVKLAPGQSAWAGLSFSNPEISGAHTATPASLVVTPPDEKDSLTVKWTQGKVPVSGNSSSVRLTVVRVGSGA
ncbi:DUF4232 domain-containing protein [Streptomyces sp. NPDC048243]|uniref:DUF4232 domain-containing protein n=1 Tax=Streptomyces sp. NPDC048243 TaxID=3365522 RepID=UPI00371137AF